MKTMKPNPVTQRDSGLGFDGAETMRTPRVSRDLHRNQWSGHLNDGRLVQMNQQPNRTGNDGTCHHSGMGQSGHTPPAMAVKGRPSDMDAINAGSGPRGGGRRFEPSATKNYQGNADRINVGRGPTRGNQQ